MYWADLNGLTSEHVSIGAGRQRQTIQDWIKMKPWHHSGKPSHTCFSFPLVISGNENWTRCYVFGGLEGLYIFLSYNMLTIKCVSLSTKRQDLSVPGRRRKKNLEVHCLKNRFGGTSSPISARRLCQVAPFLLVHWHVHLQFSLPFHGVAVPFTRDVNDKVE